MPSNLESNKVMQEASDKQDVSTNGVAKHVFSRVVGKDVAAKHPLVMSIAHLLKDLKNGRIEIRWPGGVTTGHGQGGQRVNLDMHNTTPIRELFFGGHNGFAESYFQGHWSCSDLPALFGIVMHNEDLFSGTLTGKWFARIKNVFHHVSNRNSISGSKRNISFHYDLGNDFYKLWLDSSMTYSAALYKDSKMSLAQAQQDKLQRIASLLSPAQHSQVLEIGCGWGALGNHLVSHADCNLHGVSLSRSQLDYADQRYDDPRLTFEYRDYRDVDGRYDHIVSIEMFEAVGMAYWNTYFEKLSTLLTDTGSVLLQVITIDEDWFEGKCGEIFLNFVHIVKLKL